MILEGKAVLVVEVGEKPKKKKKCRRDRHMGSRVAGNDRRSVRGCFLTAGKHEFTKKKKNEQGKRLKKRARVLGLEKPERS